MRSMRKFIGLTAAAAALAAVMPVSAQSTLDVKPVEAVTNAADVPAVPTDTKVGDVRAETGGKTVSADAPALPGKANIKDKAEEKLKDAVKDGAKEMIK